ncbi:hypothetical protein [Methylobacterium haplocladii]|uniref:Uncharacterized protein n=1 Tax=Methylobacterium haplocladii TaxID=1176176 RepID=A0A512IV22_9HYPH|nr:hypothetical protein [Methylobacterium haplocladii]GEP01562.1 hypothetical protein MHA02_39490 [Methylobacterium haplocladii]GJD85402.1 hypothetical protein HPGCJGGD_3291 [Methylobacterium haplocladii]GLS59369.1 hypothetical protein GCM10007887_20350 [Methylobacterium haplocladii]
MLRPLLAATFGLALATLPALAQPKPDPDWPCAQRKVPTLGYGSFWTGPDLMAVGEWGNDREAAQLARKLASRRTELSEVDGLLDDFVKDIKDKDEKDKRLTRVFAGVFEVINGERNTVVSGIIRYAQGQQRLAKRIREEADKVSETRDGPAEDATKVATKEGTDLETAFNWDRRIFDERNKSVTYVCEVPTLLEQRLGDLARKIQAKL